MQQEVRELLDRFDRLSRSEKLEVLSELLTRVKSLEFDPLSDEELARTADEMFLELDRAETVGERN